MKALLYMASKGVPLKGDRDSLIHTILFFSPLGSKNLALYPESSLWGDPDLERVLVDWLDGNVVELVAALREMTVNQLVVFLSDVMDTICWDWGLDNKVADLPQAVGNSERWASLWNGFLEIAPNEKGAWSNKREVIEAYATENRWGAEVKPIVQMCT